MLKAAEEFFRNFITQKLKTLNGPTYLISSAATLAISHGNDMKPLYSYTVHIFIQSFFFSFKKNPAVRN